MRICLLGDFSGNPDEGMKNVSRTVKGILSIQHKVLAINSRDIVQTNVVKKLKKFEPEIIHYLHGPTIRSLTILKGLRILLGSSVKVVVSATRPYFSKYGGWVIPFLKPDLILTQSIRFESFFKEKGCSVEFMPNGVDCDKFFPLTDKDEKRAFRKEYDLPEDKNIILHVGHIKTNRNLKIFKKIQQANLIQVVIVGSISENADEKLKNELQKSGVKIYHEYFEDISKIYKTADLYVFPIIDTGTRLPDNYNQIGAIDLPLSVLEAMACNLPVVTTRFGALQRMFENGGGLHYAEDEDNIIAKVKNFSYNKSCNTREKVLPYDWQQIVSRIESIYQDILQ